MDFFLKVIDFLICIDLGNNFIVVCLRVDLLYLDFFINFNFLLGCSLREILFIV